MSIRMNLMPPRAYNALQQFCNYMDWRPVEPWMDCEHVAWLMEQLKHAPDTVEIFPLGKWAMVQWLQAELSRMAKKEFRK